MKSDDLRSLYERETGWVSHYWMGVGKHRAEYARQEYTAWLERRAAVAGELAEALKWAKNELDHDTDETNCCYRRCSACKRRRKNKLWNDWWNRGHDPVAAALAAWGEVAGEKGRGT